MQKGRAVKIVLTIATITILLDTTILPVVRSEVTNDGVPVILSTSDGEITEKQLSVEDVGKLAALLNALQSTPTEYGIYLPSILNELTEYGLIEEAENMEQAILETVQCSSGQAYVSDTALFFNVACFVVGHGSNSHLWTPVMLFSVLMLLSVVTFPLGFAMLFYQSLRPRLSVPMGGWLINSGGMHTLGLLGAQDFFRRTSNAVPVPSLILLFGFTGLWISFPIGGIENEFFVGSAVAVFGG